MTPQSTFMIAAEIAAGREDDLRATLASMTTAPGYADPRNALVPFHQFSTLHVARFTILHAPTNDDIARHGVKPRHWAPTLVFLGDIDGPADVFLAELCVRAGQGLTCIFSHCTAFETDSTDLLAWLVKHNQAPAANYVNWRGRTVVQVREECALALFVREKMADVDRRLDNRQLHLALRAAVCDEVAELRLRLSPPQPTPPGWWLKNLAHLLCVPFLALMLLPIAVLAAPLYIWKLRRLEASDPENTQRADPRHVAQLVATEDLAATNHFNVFGQVKPGAFRRYTIKTLLVLLDYANRHIYHRGYLTRIQTIHFARWVLMDNGTRVFFASNYDGSADSYMDDFINKVAWGLNLVFSNGVGYPRTRFLIKGGAEYEGKYKRTLRRNQLPSQCWYKAYPDLTAVDLARHNRLRLGLERERLNDQELREWARLL